MSTASLICSTPSIAPITIMSQGNATSGGAAIPATTTAGVTNGLDTVTFSANISLPAGTPLLFSSQPTLPQVPQGGSLAGPVFTPTTPTLPVGPLAPAIYYLATAVVSGMSGTLTTPYTGVTNTATVFTSPQVPGSSAPYVTLGIILKSSLTIAGTANVLQGSPAVLFSSAQTLPKGAAVTFASDPASVYTLKADVDASMAATLDENYAGTTDTTTGVTNVTPIATVLDFRSAVCITRSGQRAPIIVKTWGEFASSDTMLFFLPRSRTVVTVVEQGSQPLTLVAVAANALNHGGG
jgi:hypothetical protein